MIGAGLALEVVALDDVADMDVVLFRNLMNMSTGCTRNPQTDVRFGHEARDCTYRRWRNSCPGGRRSNAAKNTPQRYAFGS